MNAVVNPMFMGLGTTELLIILGVLILLFGAKKLPELARGSGRALRIFKSETKGLMDDDEPAKTEEQKQIDAQLGVPEAHHVEPTAAETTGDQRRPESDR